MAIKFVKSFIEIWIKISENESVQLTLIQSIVTTTHSIDFIKTNCKNILFKNIKICRNTRFAIDSLRFQQQIRSPAVQPLNWPHIFTSNRSQSNGYSFENKINAKNQMRHVFKYGAYAQKRYAYQLEWRSLRSSIVDKMCEINFHYWNQKWNEMKWNVADGKDVEATWNRYKVAKLRRIENLGWNYGFCCFIDFYFWF